MRAATYLVELLVGLACLAGVMPLWRRGGRARVAGALLAVAGVAAVAHAALGLVP